VGSRLLGVFAGADGLDGTAAFIGAHAAGSAAVDNVRRIIALTAGTAAGARMRFDASLARGLSYYTGAIMEINVPDLAGSLGGGGRYDNLVGMFSGENIPACGFSLGLERILVVMAERGMFPRELRMNAADIMVAALDPEGLPHAIALAGALRAADLRVFVYPEPDKIGKQLKYAESRGIPSVAILGGDEIARGEVTVKLLAERRQQTVSIDGAGKSVKELLGRG